MTPVDDAFDGTTLVTGANGFIGSAVVRRLLSRGMQVRCLVRSPSRCDRLAGLDVEIAAGDVRDERAVNDAVRGCHRVIHLAGPSAWRLLDAPDVRPTIVEGTRLLLSSARQNHVTRTVYVSSAVTLGPADDPTPRDELAAPAEIDPQEMPYAAAKREAESLCRAAATSGQDVVVVNPAEVFGPGDSELITAGSLLSLVGRGAVFYCPGGTSVVHVDDAATAIVAALERGRAGERYLVGGENLTHRQLVELVGSLAGRRRLAVRVPACAVRVGAHWARVSGMPFPMPLAAVPYVIRYWHLDCRRAREELGVTFRPAVETLRETLDWLRSADYWR